MRPKPLFAIVLVFALAFVSASAQQLTSRVEGVIKDGTGAVVPGVQVTMINTATNDQSSTVTSEIGFYLFPQVRVGTYTVTAEMPAFKKAVVNNFKVDVGVPGRLDIALELGDVTEIITVSAEGQAVINLVDAELNTTVSQRKIQDLPLATRNPVNLAGLQAGVASTSGATAPRNARINGLRGSYNNITHDGVNVQDNLVRTGGLFALTSPSVDNVSEFSITTQQIGADAGLGVAQIRLVTPSGSNEFHGAVYEYHRNDALDANSFFNNAANIDTPKLIRNQFGGRAGGSVVKDKVFYFGHLEFFRQRQDAQLTRNVLTPASRQGIFAYTSGGVSRTVDLLALSGGTIDPFIAQTIALTPLPNDPTSTDPNIQRFRFNSPAPSDNENWTLRGDWNINDSNRLESVWQNFDSRFPNDTFNDIGEPFPGLPGGGQASTRQRLAIAWQSNSGTAITNEARFGFQRAPVAFTNTEPFANGFILTGFPQGMDNPIRTFQPQGRNSPAFDYIDNATWVKGNHAFRFGGSYRWYHSDLFNNAGIVPTYTLGFGTNNNVSPLATGQFPGGISGTQFSRAEAYLAFLTGTVTQGSQSFNVLDRTNGFVGGAGEERDYGQGILAFYGGDTWRATPSLTVNFGLRWEYHSPVDEKDGLSLLPQGDFLNPNTIIDFAGGDSGDLYPKDWNNLAPSISFAWDPFGDGKTSVRSGYSISYVVDSALSAVRNAVRANTGLQAGNVLRDLAGTVSAGGIVPIPTPVFQVPRTQQDNLALDSQDGLFTIDQTYATPYVQQWSLSIERKITPDTAFEVRYVGNRGTKLSRGWDANQANIFGANGQFLQDFITARNNLINNGNPYVGDPIPTFDLFGNRGFLNSFRSLLLNNEIGDLIVNYLANRNFLFASTDPVNRPGGERFGAVVGGDFFYPNGEILFADAVGNISFSTYHGLQMEMRRQFKDGLTFQGNYTYSKNLTDFDGSQSNFSGLLDNARPGLEKQRASQDTTHVFNANWIYELPFGVGRRWMNGGGIVDKFLGGWQVGGIANWQSGEAITIRSNRGTFNRRSANNTLFLQGLTIPELQSLTGSFRLPDGRVSLFDPSILDLSGGQVRASSTNFVLPGAGEVGTLGLTPVSGPQFFNFDFSLIKRTSITEGINLQFRAEFFNMLNRTNFNPSGTQTITSTTFGIINSTFASRIIQFAFRLEW